MDLHIKKGWCRMKVAGIRNYNVANIKSNSQTQTQTQTNENKQQYFQNSSNSNLTFGSNPIKDLWDKYKLPIIAGAGIVISVLTGILTHKITARSVADATRNEMNVTVDKLGDSIRGLNNIITTQNKTIDKTSKDLGSLQSKLDSTVNAYRIERDSLDSTVTAQSFKIDSLKLLLFMNNSI